MEKPNRKYKKELNALRKQITSKGELSDLRDLFFRVEETYKGRDCIVEKKKKLIVTHTVDEFCEDVKALGSELISMGYSGSHIAILGENSYNWVVSFFAITVSGNVAVPLDKELQKEDIEKLIIKSDSTAVFCSKNFSSYVEKCDINKFSLSDYQENSVSDLVKSGKDKIKNGNNSFYNVNVASEDTAVIIFTSGTTGTNKGVMLSHKNLCVNAEGILGRLKHYYSQLSVLPMNHVYELGCNVIPYIYFNGILYINDRLRNYAENMKLFKPEIMAIVPLFAEDIKKNIILSAKKDGSLDKLYKTIDISNKLLNLHIDLRNFLFRKIRKNFGYRFPAFACGGAHIEPSVVKFLTGIGFDMYLGYGLTETSPIVTLNTNSLYDNYSMGTPFPKTSFEIRDKDKDGNGDIWVKGENVSNGYYKDENADAVSFKDGWFFTGDCGKEENGKLYITGRKKNLIILDNGKNVYPEEIESFFILNTDFVKEAVVFETKDESNENAKNVLGLAVSIGENADLSNESEYKKIISELNKKLPIYKRVQVIEIFNTEFPKTSTKKIIRADVLKLFNDRRDNKCLKN